MAKAVPFRASGILGLAEQNVNRFWQVRANNRDTLVANLARTCQTCQS